MTVDCSFNWSGMTRVMGPQLRPGGGVLTERALEVCNLTPNSRVVDIGCGAGGTLENLERVGLCRSVGLDYSQSLLGDAVRRLGPGRFVSGRAEKLPFKNASFDAVFCECVLSILGDREGALRECDRVLKGDGFLAISDVFQRGRPVQERPEGASQDLGAEGLPAKEELVGFLSGLGFSLLLWEEYERLLKEFAARMILAGVGLPDLWGCRRGQEGKKADRTGMSYFLLVARKPAIALSPKQE